jgi:hypothetical protein
VLWLVAAGIEPTAPAATLLEKGVDHMRTLRLLCLAICLASLGIASAGPTSASAVALCKEGGAGACPKAQTYPAKTAMSGTLKGVYKFETQEGEEELSGECKQSSWKGETTAESGEKSVPGTLSSMTASECTSVLGACTTQMLNLPWATTIDNMGNYAWTNGGTGAPAIRVSCLFGFFHCRYSANAIIATIVPGNPAVANVNQTLALQADPPGGNSFGCGATYRYVASYNVAPQPMFIR